MAFLKNLHTANRDMIKRGYAVNYPGSSMSILQQAKPVENLNPSGSSTEKLTDKKEKPKSSSSIKSKGVATLEKQPSPASFDEKNIKFKQSGNSVPFDFSQNDNLKTSRDKKVQFGKTAIKQSESNGTPNKTIQHSQNNSFKQKEINLKPKDLSESDNDDNKDNEDNENNQTNKVTNQKNKDTKNKETEKTKSNKLVEAVQTVNSKNLSEIEIDDLSNSADILKVDIIIIGCGTAGSIITRNLVDLNKDKKYRILCLEWGSNFDNDPNIKNPDNYSKLCNGSKYQTLIPQTFDSKETGKTTNNAPIKVPIMAGGTTSGLPLLPYILPSDESLNEWKIASGYDCINAWSAKKILGQIKKSEKVNMIDQGDNRGEKGLVAVTVKNQSKEDDNNPISILSKSITGDLFNDAPPSPDYNSNDFNTGYSTCIQYQQEYSKNTLVRGNNSRNFLKVGEIIDIDGKGIGEEYENLRVVYGAKVKKITFGEKNAVATGVEVLINGNIIKIKASKKIILSAGIHSSSILQLSGVGDSSQLKKIGIPCKVENKYVGKNLMVQSDVRIIVSSEVPLTDSELIFFYSLDSKKKESRQCQVHSTTNISDLFDQSITSNYGFSNNPNEFGLIGTNLLPLSRGQIQITSSDFTKPPEIQTGILSKKEDLDIAKVMLQSLIVMINTANTKNKDVKFKVKFPKGSGFKLNDKMEFDEDDQSFVEYIYNNRHHFHQNVWFGSNKMGLNNAKYQGVVNETLHVHGTENLMIIDSSVIPAPPGGSVNTLVNSIAEIGSIIASKTINN